MGLDKRSFVLGMVTAFCECVAGGCKKLALSPPLSSEDYRTMKEEIFDLIEKHGLIYYHEENLDRPPESRFEWVLIAARRETIDSYISLRRQGFSPADSLSPFSALLSYNENESVHTGYDAFREFFG